MAIDTGIDWTRTGLVGSVVAAAVAVVVRWLVSPGLFHYLAAQFRDEFRELRRRLERIEDVPARVERLEAVVEQLGPMSERLARIEGMLASLVERHTGRDRHA